MCGLVGIAGYISTAQAKMFRDMLIFDTVRGLDSTGVAALRLSEPSVVVEKELGGPTNLWDWQVSKIFDDKGKPLGYPKLLLGHNRAATLGKITVENAHPFVCDHIVGAHNGTLREWRELDNYKENDIDSLSIFQTIANKGIDHCWKSFLGAAALSFYDKKANMLYLIRNSERPLTIVNSKDGRTVMWASEQWMLEVAAKRNKVDLECKENSTQVNYISLKPDWLHGFKLGLDATLEEVRELEKKPLPQTRSSTSSIYTSGKGNTNKPTNFPKTGENQRKINISWATGLKKAEKEVRGCQIELSYEVPHPEDEVNSNPQEDRYYIVGRIVDGPEKDTRITIHPETYGEYKFWAQRAESKCGRYLLQARPRIELWPDGRFFGYRVSATNVKRIDLTAPTVGKVDTTTNVVSVEDYKKLKDDGKVRLYPGPKGKEYNVNDWWTQLLYQSPDCTCLACSNPISIEDADRLLWLDNAVLCTTCQENPHVMEYFESSGKTA